MSIRGTVPYSLSQVDWHPEKHRLTYDSFAQSAYFMSCDIEYDKYIHFIFSAWTISMLIFSIMLFGWHQGILLRYSVDVWYAGMNVFFVRKFLFFAQIVIRNCAEILKWGYYFSYKLLDKGLFEVVLAYGIVYVISDLLRQLRFLHRGLLYHYAGIFWLGLILISMAVLL